MNDFIKIRDNDDVIIALKDFKKGDIVDNITLLNDVCKGHKIAINDFKKDHLLIKYGTVIGKLKNDVKKGEWIHSHNLMTHLEGDKETYTYKKEVNEKVFKDNRTFLGYLRKNGEAGIRNDIYIVPTVGCVNNISSLIRDEFLKNHEEFKGRVKILAHPFGCSQLGEDLDNTKAILAGLMHNANAGGILLLGLGCENNRLSEFLPLVSDLDKERFYYFNAQDVEDEVSEGSKILEKLAEKIKEDKRVPLPLNKLILGVKCGGSDGFSGLTANPLVGLISDTIGGNEGKVLLTEVPEMFGAETFLMKRAKDEKTFNKIVDLINNFKAYYAKNNQPCYENPSPGNKDGGITTLEEKSNGCILKGGSLEIHDVLNFGEHVKESKLSLVNGPGNDLMASTLLAASGATLILFTTGRGTPFGSLVPTLKIATNHQLANKKSNWIDFDAGSVLDNGFEKEREELLDLIIKVASGEEVKAEKTTESLISIFKSGVTL